MAEDRAGVDLTAGLEGDGGLTGGVVVVGGGGVS